MKNHLIYFSVLLVISLLARGCAVESTTLSQVVVEQRDHEFIVTASGDIIATESIEVRVPDTVRTQYSIAWMVPEFSQVEEGEIVVRFDDLDIRNLVNDSELGIIEQQSSIDAFLRGSVNEKSQIVHNSMRVDGETDIAESYEDVDLSFFSKHEQIDQLGDLEYLRMQGSFYDWQGETHQRRSDAELGNLQAQKKTREDELNKNKLVLENMTITSPADGTYVYASNWWGEQVRTGSTVWPGSQVGMIPIRGKVEARLYVLEIDALGLEVDQLVRLRLHSDLSQEFTGRITKLSNIASTKDRVSPTKYFTVNVTFDNVDPDLMRVGSSIDAKIVTGELDDALLVPQQAVHHDAESSYVFVVTDGVAERRDVEVGHRSPTLIQIVGGLSAGESISLVKPATPSA